MQKAIEGEEDFDGNVLKDGGRYRVPLRMTDSLGRAVAKQASKQRLVDQSGNGGLALHRPGYRQLTGGSANTQSAWDALNRATANAYELDRHFKQNAWRDAILDQDDDDAVYAATTEAKGTDAYLDYEARIKDEWKHGNE